MHDSFRSLIEQWPTVAALAADIGKNPEAVKKWKQRNSIPSDAWGDLLAAARKRKIKLNEAGLIRLASRQADAA